MKRSHAFIALAVVAIVAAIAIFIFIHPNPGRVDGPRILQAAQTYAHDLSARGLPVPTMVPLQELLTNGLVQPADVTGFTGMDVKVSLTATAKNPQSVLLRVRMQDGAEFVTLADGSVQEVTK